MTVTLPVHPLVGARLTVVRFVRHQDGRRYIDVEHPRGWTLRLPLDWTDRAASWAPPRISGCEVRLAVRGLVQLARAVDAALCRKLDHSVEVPTLPEHREGAGSDVRASSAGGETADRQRVDHAVGGDSTRRTRCVGDSGSQDAARRDRSRGVR